MVKSSDLKKLDDLEDKRSDRSKEDGMNFIPESINWMISTNPTKPNLDPSTKLRNKRLQYLFEGHNNKSTISHDDFPYSDKPDESTSFDFPTTHLKSHELTNKLELEFIESSSLFETKSTGDKYSDIQYFRPANRKSSEIRTFDTIHSFTTSNSLPTPRSVYSNPPILPDFTDQPKLTANLTSQKRKRKLSSAGSPPPVSIKRFKSISQCDLVFPNLDFKKPH
ncbi:hypothetical protein G210_1726, partial [Candida maltosa Xu316]